MDFGAATAHNSTKPEAAAALRPHPPRGLVDFGAGTARNSTKPEVVAERRGQAPSSSSSVTSAATGERSERVSVMWANSG